jgi:hypothetical protein
MPIYDSGFKIVARHGGRYLAQIGRVAVDAWQPIVSELQTTERLADRAFRARRGKERFVVYMEAYTVWTSDAPWSILAKSTLLAERERLPVRSLVYILQPRRYRPQGGRFRLSVGNEATQQVWFREICLWQQQPQGWWSEVPALMALYPLYRQTRPAQEALRYAAEAITRGEANIVARADLLTTLAIFGKLVYPRVDVLGLIGREQMRESKIYEEIKEEGRLEGRLNTLREAVLDALETKFGAGARSEFGAAIQAETDPARLSRLHRLAVRADNMNTFRSQYDGA